ncbi:MAG TPA: MTH1187 family thiamine-binding protein [Victivallales bacterium]|nr:MTH1187 family thiamine-binding protein [Victivallales bacterium]
MHVIVDFCVIPMGVGVSVSKYVTACEKILNKAKLKTILHSYGTNVEGEWDEVFNAIKQCHDEIHKMGAPRISTTIRLGTRVDKDQSMEDKIKSVKDKM